MPQIKNFTGIRNNVSAERFAPEDLATAKNVDLDNTGKLLTRKGFTARKSGAFHSLWAYDDYCLFVNGAQLHRLSDDLVNSTVIRGDLTAGLNMSYDHVNNQVYYSNGMQTGIYSNGTNRTWGIVPPVYQPLAQATAGDLPMGKYQFALTYIRSDGQESGTGIADFIELQDGQAINFTDIAVSSDPSVTFKVIYVSPQNGDMLYQALILPNATTSASYNGADLRKPLTTQFMQHAPAGQIVKHFSGVFYVAYENFIFYSDTLGFELFDLRNYLPFDSVVTMIAPVQDGMFIGTQKKIHFLAGRDPKTSQLSTKAEFGVLPNSMSLVPTIEVAGLENAPQEYAPMFVSTDGICIGISGGTLINLNEANFRLEASGSAATIFRKSQGIDQFIASITN